VAWGAAAGPVKVWATFRDRRYAAGAALAWKPAGAVASDAIMLDPAATRQEILGFGAALTDASCYVLDQIPAEQRAEVMHDLFAPSEMAFKRVPHGDRRERLFADGVQL